ncbi:MAG: hypothetical protein WC205_09400 [Opitutaceae bacterium]|jgi:hypothetical protein
MKDHDPLSPLLGSWQHTPSPAPDFADKVWSRIRTEVNSPSPAPIIRFPFAIPLPLAASVAVTLSILAGSLGALAVNRSQSTDRMAAAYVRTIDPIQMTAGDQVHTDSPS